MVFMGEMTNGVTYSATKKAKLSISIDRSDQEYRKYNSIIFAYKNCDGLAFSHNDVLVISFYILAFIIKCVLIDLGSSANILQLRILEEKQLTDKINPAIKLLASFNMSSELTWG